MIKAYLLSLGVGLLAGVMYGALSVKSPAPPVIALVGLFGMLMGEQLVPIIKNVVTGRPALATAASSTRHPGATHPDADV